MSNRKITFARPLRAALAFAMALLAALALIATPARAATLTVVPAKGNEGATYKAYQVFSADVTPEGKAQNVTWASDAVRDAVVPALRAGGATDADLATAQDAAEYINAHVNGTEATDASTKLAAGSLGMGIAKALDGLAPQQILRAGQASELAQGWWLVVTQKATAGTSPVFALVGASDVTVNEKADVPGVTKKVQGGTATSANTGEPLQFEVTGTVAANVASYDTYYYAFTDTPDGLAIDASTAKVVLVNGEETVSVTPDTCKVQNGELSVGFNDLKSAAAAAGVTLDAATTVRLTYTARITAQAVVGADGNSNSVTLTYSNNPLTQGRGTTTPSKTKTYTYRLRVLKHKAGDESTLLSGAGFTFQASDGRYLQADGSLAANKHVFTTDADGTISVSGVGAGVYAVQEETAPKGYEKTDPFSLAITDNAADLVPNEADLTLTAKVSGNSAAVPSADASKGIVTVSVANETTPPTPPTPESPNKPSGSTPRSPLNIKTGDTTTYGLAAILAVAGAAAIAIAVGKRRSQKQ
jgi:fimbrial isopeptide formation D2 family protein